MLELQKYLQTHSFAELTEQYGIKVVQSVKYPELYLFKYSQIDSPMGEKIVQESRGIILNSSTVEWLPVSRPYDKFFNYREGHAAEIDWSTARVYDKLDGSLVTLYWYGDKWNVATSGNPDAAGEVWNGLGRTITFEDLFWETWNKEGYRLPHYSLQHLCFIFELMTPYNKVVVQHKESTLVLHGVRSLSSQAEFDPVLYGEYEGYKVCPIFNFNSIEEVVHNCSQLEPIKNEGYVIVDSKYRRIKVKSPQYVALAHMKDSMSPRNIIEIVRTNEMEEFLVYFKEYTEIYEDIKARYEKLVDLLEKKLTYLTNRFESLDYRGMALYLKGSPYQGFLMGIMRHRKSTVRQGLQELNIKKLEEWLRCMN